MSSGYPIPPIKAAILQTSGPWGALLVMGFLAGIAIFLYRRGHAAVVRKMKEGPAGVAPGCGTALPATGHPVGRVESDEVAGEVSPFAYDVIDAGDPPPLSPEGAHFLRWTQFLWEERNWIYRHNAMALTLLVSLSLAFERSAGGLVLLGFVGLATWGKAAPANPRKVRDHNAFVANVITCYVWYVVAFFTLHPLVTGVAVAVEVVRKKRLEVRSRFLPQVDLLFLWVFGCHTKVGRVMSDIHLLWRRVGDIYFLRGKGHMHDPVDALGYLARLMSGKTEGLVTADPGQLSERLEELDRQPVRAGYGLKSLLCGDAVWKAALDGMVGRAEVTLMDLGGFGPENRGCSHELGRLVDRVRTDCFLLVIDDETDLPLLLQLLEEAWKNMAAESPNRDGAGAIRILTDLDTAWMAEPDREDWSKVARLRTRATEPLMALIAECGAAYLRSEHPSRLRQIASG